MSDAIDPEWATWFMGFLEGDGGFYIGHTGSPECKVELRNDDWQVLADIKAKIMAGTLTLHNNQYSRNKGQSSKDSISWRVYGVDCLSVVEVLEAADSDKYFDYWLAGFMDAEGHFRIQPGGSAECEILLRNDDWRAITNIRATAGVGAHVIRRPRDKGKKTKGCVGWRVGSNPECLEVINLLEGKMRTKKALDFSIWADSVRYAASQKRGAPGKKEKMLEYKAMLEDARKYVAPSEEELQAALGRFKEGGLDY